MTLGALIRRLDAGARGVAPVLSLLIFALMETLPLAMPAGWPSAPGWSLMAAFYWIVYRPDLTPPWVLFLIGAAQDAAAGGLWGLSSLTLLATYGLVLPNRLMFLGRPFAQLWWGFSVIAALAAAWRWLLAPLLTGRVVAPSGAFSQFVLSVLLFPLVVWLFVRTHRRLLPSSGHSPT